MNTASGMSVTTSHQIQGLKLLDGKTAVIYGAAGGVGTAVAKAFAREGATVFLTGRTENSLKRIADDISGTGGVADVSKVDALSSETVESHLNRVVAKAGKLDISFNLIGTSIAVFTHLTKLRGTTFQAIADSEAQNTALKRAPFLPDVANAAVLIASDYASGITATTVNASCGELVD